MNWLAYPKFFYHTKQVLSLLSLGLFFSFSCSKNTSSALTTDPLSAIAFYLTDTGQTTSYTLTPGEDADYLINAPSFTDNGDGTVSDNNTGLIWQKTDGGEMTYENAATYCKNLSLGGHTDWRLPTGFELFGINNYDKVNPALDTNFFTKTLAEYWWTSEGRADDANDVWVVNAGGGIGAHPKSETLGAGGTKRFHVRAVRISSSVIRSSAHLSDNGDGTLTDNYTGLIWQKNPASSLSWEESLKYATSLSLAGKSDWRIPNIRELQSLNDATLTKPSFNKTFFPGISSGNFWSSTSQVNSPARAWDINVDYGIVSYNDKMIRENVLCVRGGNKK